MTYAYGLREYILASGPFLSAPIFASKLMDVGNKLQESIPVASKTLWIGTV